MRQRGSPDRTASSISMCWVHVSTLHSGSYRKTSPCSKAETAPSGTDSATASCIPPPAENTSVTLAPGRALHCHGRADSSLSCTVPSAPMPLLRVHLCEEPELPFLSAKANRTGLKVGRRCREHATLSYLVHASLSRIDNFFFTPLTLRHLRHCLFKWETLPKPEEAWSLS